MSDSNTPQEATSPDMDDLDQFTLAFNGQEPKEPEAKAVASPDEEETAEETETEVDETETEAEVEAEAEAPKKKSKQTAEERVREVVAKLRETERREQETARRLKDLEDKLSTPAPKEAPKVEGAPKPTDTLPNGEDKYPLGEYDPNYIADVTKFTFKVEMEADRNRQEQERKANEAKAEYEALSSTWSEKLDKARETYPDLDDSNAALEDAFRGLEPKYGEMLAKTIMSLGNGPDVLHYLGQNIEEAKKIVSSGPIMAPAHLGRLDARFDKETEEKKPQPKVTKAPTPPPQVTKGTASRMSVPPDTDDLDAFSMSYFAEKPVPKKAKTY